MRIDQELLKQIEEELKNAIFFVNQMQNLDLSKEERESAFVQLFGVGSSVIVLMKQLRDEMQ